MIPPGKNYEKPKPIIADAGYFYCPYIPLTKPPKPIKWPKKTKNILTRYGKKLLADGEKYYGKITL